ncbi:DUF2849 domain-containing protein [Marivita sp. GX14005]|uniref:DUF2849 domain-containing protein n=1 Tax=Marivita sp. GX14005 TaxID=2942276 RepID=UPI002018ACEA|nr:DUF2849 domain-containing protein [Marivita sp. GX14005]MCL3882621.1 DUF2849 domain-containing protein [Marivita sp. GX14005]
MTKPFTPKIVTANALLEGDVVYLTEDDSWTRDHAEAEILTDEAHAQLRLIDGSRRHNEVVGVYLAEVTQTENGPAPVHFREAFRSRGPSNYKHGKQAGSL